jgi:PAS domain S-box-containing protein
MRKSSGFFALMTTESTRRTLRNSIVLKVTLIVALTIAVLLIAMLTVGYVFGRQTILADVRSKVVAIATARQTLLHDSIAREQERIGLVANRPRLRQLAVSVIHGSASLEERDELTRVLVEVVAARKGFLNVSIVSPEGRVLAASDSALAGQEFYANAAVKRGLVERYLDQPRHVGAEYLTWVSAPIHDDQQRAIAVAIGEVNITTLCRALTAAVGLGATGEVLLGRREGGEIQFLLPARNAPEMKSAPMKDLPVLTAAINGRTSFAHLRDYRHVPVLVTGRPVGYDNWGLVVKMDAAEVYRPLTTAWNAAAAFSIAAVVAGLLAGYALARGLTRPILQLATAARAVTGGRLDTRVPVTSADELGALARAFNEMTDSVQRSLHELRASEERFRLLVDSVQDYAIIMLDTEGCVASWNAGAERITGYAENQIRGRHVSAFYSAEDVAAGKPARSLKQAVQTGRCEEEGWRTRPGGSRYWASVMITAVRDAEGWVHGFAHVTHDVTARREADERLRGSLHEKEVLLQEIHHRVKNNMQIISSLMNLQAGTLGNVPAAEPFRDARDRVRSMALVHEQLYQSRDFSRIDFGDYARSLMKFLLPSTENGTQVSVTFDIERTQISLNAAVPCGLILNELTTNAIKHAFRGRAAGEICVALHAVEEGRFVLSFRDNGVGLPQGFDIARSPSLGLKLVRMLAEQLGGQLEIIVHDGTEFRIAFQVEEPAERAHVRQ